MTTWTLTGCGCCLTPVEHWCEECMEGWLDVSQWIGGAYVENMSNGDCNNCSSLLNNGLGDPPDPYKLLWPGPYYGCGFENWNLAVCGSTYQYFGPACDCYISFGWETIENIDYCFLQFMIATGEHIYGGQFAVGEDHYWRLYSTSPYSVGVDYALPYAGVILHNTSNQECYGEGSTAHVIVFDV